MDLDEKLVERVWANLGEEPLRVSLSGLIVMNVESYPARVALRAYAYAAIAMGNQGLGDALLALVGKEG